MSTETLARWQFATTTVLHFVVVPLSIGLCVLVAVLQTIAWRTENPAWERAARLYGRLLLVTFTLGVVTGIVQEFQFGMNWSSYSRFVGDIFGAPLAMEALIAFFLESTFLALWAFGRELLRPGVRVAAIWLAAVGTVASAYFILAANSWMQHPVGWHYDPVTNRAELTSIVAVLTNSTQLVTFPHVILGTGVTVGAIVLGVSAWHLRRAPRTDGVTDPVHGRLAVAGAAVVLLSALATSGVGHLQGEVMTTQQPMKMAAAEALWTTTSHAPFSLFAVGDPANNRNIVDITIPDGLSLLATGRPGGTVQGITDVQAAESAAFGAGSYTPTVWVEYWTFRLMIGFGVLAMGLAALVLVQARRGRLRRSPLLLRAATWGVVLPILANSSGWIFTEVGRQPWLVYGVLKTASGVSAGVGRAAVGGTLVGSALLYGVAFVLAGRFFVRIARIGTDVDTPSADPDGGTGLPRPDADPAVPALVD